MIPHVLESTRPISQFIGIPGLMPPAATRGREQALNLPLACFLRRFFFTPSVPVDLRHRRPDFLFLDARLRTIPNPAGSIRGRCSESKISSDLSSKFLWSQRTFGALHTIPVGAPAPP